MTTDERVTNVVYAAIDELNKQLPKGVHLEKALDAPLYGPSGKLTAREGLKPRSLESLDFVTLVMEIEERIKAEFGVDITIADENLLSRENSPFSSVRTLIEYLERVLKQDGN